MRYANLALIMLFSVVSFIALPGCGNDGNIVIDSSSEAYQATPEEAAAYEKEMAERAEDR